MKPLTVITIVIALGNSGAAQEKKSILEAWRSTPSRNHVAVKTQAIKDIVASDSASFPIGPARLAHGSIGADGSISILLATSDNTVRMILFHPDNSPKKDGKENQGGLSFLAGADGVEIKFVRGSDAEKNLLAVLKNASDAASKNNKIDSASLNAIRTLLCNYKFDEQFPPSDGNKPSN